MKKNTNLVDVYGETCLEICLVPLSLEPGILLWQSQALCVFM